jgi:hypothetical protein
LSLKPSLTSLARAALGLLAAATAACHGEREEALRAEAGRVAEAVRKLREAPNPAKPPLRKALDATSCTTEDTCGLKKSCANAYALQERALEGLAAVRHATTGASAAEPVPSAAAALLSDVTANLERAKTLSKDCADLEGAVRRKYSL